MKFHMNRIRGMGIVRFVRYSIHISGEIDTFKTRQALVTNLALLGVIAFSTASRRQLFCSLFMPSRRLGGQAEPRDH